jgi:iron(III) transport system substrate-binding protein
MHLPHVLTCLLATTLCAGCIGNSDREVVVYTALDREFSEPVFRQFTEETGIEVRAKYDTESTKSVGLAQAILAEGQPPRCDLFWNNEIVNTLRLDQAEMLASCEVGAAEMIPVQYRSAEQTWYGFAARARILLVNTQRVADPSEYPDSVLDLAEPKWRNQIGLAKPLFGTTATHAVVLFDHWGEERAEQFFEAVSNNVHIMSGNKQVAEAVGSGELAWGITDTDDAMIEIEKGNPVVVVFPDQGPDQMGTLLIPNTLAIIRQATNQDRAQQLMEYLLSARIEQQLAAGRSAQIPLRTDVAAVSRIMPDTPIRGMEVDFAAAAARWDEVAEFIRRTFAAN